MVTYPFDLLRKNDQSWKIRGLSQNFEGEWKTVQGHDLALSFSLPQAEILRLNFDYFPTTKGQKMSLVIDGQKLDGFDFRQKDMYWQNFQAGNHTIVFHFEKLRQPGEVKGDPRPLSAAFTELTVDQMVKGSSGSFFTPLFFLLATLLALNWLIKPLIPQT